MNNVKQIAQQRETKRSKELYGERGARASSQLVPRTSGEVVPVVAADSFERVDLMEEVVLPRLPRCSYEGPEAEAEAAAETAASEPSSEAPNAAFA